MPTQLPRVTPNVMLSLEPKFDQIPYRLSSSPALGSDAVFFGSAAVFFGSGDMLTLVESNTKHRVLYGQDRLKA